MRSPQGFMSLTERLPGALVDGISGRQKGCFLSWLLNETLAVTTYAIQKVNPIPQIYTIRPLLAAELFANSGLASPASHLVAKSLLRLRGGWGYFGWPTEGPHLATPDWSINYEATQEFSTACTPCQVWRDLGAMPTTARDYNICLIIKRQATNFKISACLIFHHQRAVRIEQVSGPPMIAFSQVSWWVSFDQQPTSRLLWMENFAESLQNSELYADSAIC
jgi:hypothetical protein